MPASSIASVSSRNVSGESSTTSTMSRVSLRMGATNLLQRRCVSLEVESVHNRAYPRNEVAAFRRAAFDLVQLLQDSTHMPDLAQPNQLVDIATGRRYR